MIDKMAKNGDPRVYSLIDLFQYNDEQIKFKYKEYLSLLSDNNIRYLENLMELNGTKQYVKRRLDIPDELAPKLNSAAIGQSDWLEGNNHG
jgi:hypothetical protein